MVLHVGTAINERTIHERQKDRKAGKREMRDGDGKSEGHFLDRDDKVSVMGRPF